MSDAGTTLYKATDRLLRSRHSVSLEAWLANQVEQRQQRSPRGYADFRSIAHDLEEATGGVDVSHETVRRWWQGIEREGAQA